jgi:hypothetical protein
VDGTELFGLPWKILAHFPLFNQIVPGRLFLFVSLIVAVTSAMWLASQERPAWMRLVAAALVAASIMPNLSRSFWKGGSDEPEFFTKALYRSYLKAGETVAFLPYAWGAADDAMAWQAETGMYFRMAGGYFPLVPDSFAQWPIIRAFLQRTEVPDPVGQWKAFIANHDVDVVIFVPGPSGSASFPNLNEILSNSGPPIEVGGVRLCRIPRGELAAYRNLSPLEMEARLDAQRFAALLRAARAYLAHGGDLSSLSPKRAVQNDLLPAQWMSANSLHSNKPYSNYLWLGPSGNAQVLVGVVGTYRALQPLIDCYRRDARQVFFPYPRLLGSRTVTYATWGSLVMTFDRTGLERAATKSAP